VRPSRVSPRHRDRSSYPSEHPPLEWDAEGSSPFSRFPRRPPSQARLGARRGLTETLHRGGCVHFAHAPAGHVRVRPIARHVQLGRSLTNS
jgi:hypothetical protein